MIGTSWFFFRRVYEMDDAKTADDAPLDLSAEVTRLEGAVRSATADSRSTRRELSLLKKQLAVATKRGQTLDWTQRECARLERKTEEAEAERAAADAREVEALRRLRESGERVQQHARREEGLEERLREKDERIAQLEELLARAGTRTSDGGIDTAQRVSRLFGKEEGRIDAVTSEHRNGHRGAAGIRTMSSDTGWCADDRLPHSVSIKLEHESVLQRIELMPRRTDHRYKVSAFSTVRGWVVAVHWVRHEAKKKRSDPAAPDSEAQQVRRKLVLKDAQNGFGRPLALLGPVTELKLEAESLYRGSGAYTGCDGFNVFGWT